MYAVKRSRIIVLLMLALFLTGCANSSTKLNPKIPVTITLWHYYVGDNLIALEEAIATFNQTVGMEKGVVVDSIALGSISELEQRITDSASEAIGASPMPHIFSCYPDKALEIDNYGKLADLNPYFSQEEKAQYVTAFLEEGYFSDNRLLLLPIAKSTELLYINDTAWQEFSGQRGLTRESLTTWESLYETARQYYRFLDRQTPDVPWDGKGMLGFDAIANYVIVGNRQLGVEIIHINEGGQGRAVLNKEALRRVFSLYYKGYSMGYFDAIGKFRADDVKSGDLIAYTGSSSGASYFPTWIISGDEKKEIDFLPVTYPVFEGGEEYVVQQGAGMCVTKSDDAHQEGAVLFLKWFTGEENNIAFAMTSGYVPVQQLAYTSPLFLSKLDDLRSGSKSQRNVAATYQVSLLQITGENTYTARPFSGSYDIRTLLKNSLTQAGEEGRATADLLKQQDLTEAQILQEIDVDDAFEKWFVALNEGLIRLGIPFQRVN